MEVEDNGFRLEVRRLEVGVDGAMELLAAFGQVEQLFDAVPVEIGVRVGGFAMAGCDLSELKGFSLKKIFKFFVVEKIGFFFFDFPIFLTIFVTVGVAPHLVCGERAKNVTLVGRHEPILCILLTAKAKTPKIAQITFILCRSETSLDTSTKVSAINLSN